MTPTLRRVALLCALHGALGPTLAVAQAPAATPAAPAESPEYKRTIEAALEEYRLGHFEEARTLFARAHTLEPSARTERGLGMVEFELRHYVAALQHLQAALESRDKALTPEQRESTADLVRRAQQFVAKYSLEIEPDTREVLLELDGRRIDRQAAITLEAGEHILVVRAPNTDARELHIDVKGGEQQTLRIQLEVKGNTGEPNGPARPAAPPARSRVPLAVGLSGVGVLVIGGALGAAALARAHSSDFSDGADADRARALGLAADVTLGIGLATGVVGGVLWLVHRPGRAEADAKVALTAQGLKVRF